jgi:hypothetical protein
MHELTEFSVTRRMYPISYPFPPRKVAEFYCTYYAPTNRAHASLDEARRSALLSDLEALWTPGTTSRPTAARSTRASTWVIAVRDQPRPQ